MTEYCANRCDVCGYNGASHAIYADEDGIVRCLICRQKAKYGKVLGEHDEPIETQEWKQEWKDYIEEINEGQNSNSDDT